MHPRYLDETILGQRNPSLLAKVTDQSNQNTEDLRLCLAAVQALDGARIRIGRELEIAQGVPFLSLM